MIVDLRDIVALVRNIVVQICGAARFNFVVFMQGVCQGRGFVFVQPTVVTVIPDLVYLQKLALGVLNLLGHNFSGDSCIKRDGVILKLVQVVKSFIQILRKDNNGREVQSCDAYHHNGCNETYKQKLDRPQPLFLIPGENFGAHPIFSAHLFPPKILS